MIDSPDDLPAPQGHPLIHRLKQLWGGAKKSAWFISGIAVTFIGFLLYNAYAPAPAPLTPNEVEDIVAQSLASATPPPAISAQVYQVIFPSLVIIQTDRVDGEGEHGFGIGSGIIINSSAAILTALHVVDGASEIQVIFSDGTQSFASLFAEEPENDIAVLVPEIPPEIFLPATIGSVGAMHIGDEVFAVGHPLGLAGSMSAGVVSGFERSFTPVDSEIKLEGLIQFDAAVNPGNSGGPLLNRAGQVVGIVTGLVNPTEQDVFIGIGFAVPINVAVSGAIGGPEQ